VDYRRKRECRRLRLRNFRTRTNASQRFDNTEKNFESFLQSPICRGQLRVERTIVLHCYSFEYGFIFGAAVHSNEIVVEGLGSHLVEFRGLLDPS